METPLFTKTDFESFSRYGGGKYRKSTDSDIYSFFADKDRPGLSVKFQSIRDSLKDTTLSFNYDLNGWQNSGNIKESLWAKIYPCDIEEQCKDIVMINFSLSAKSYGENGKMLMLIDTNLKKNPKLSKLAESIKNRSIEYISEEEALSMTREQFANRITEYFHRHTTDFYEFGAEMGVKACLNKINNIKMEKYLTLLEQNHNLILTGAPGTGKTRLARDMAAKMIGCSSVTELNGNKQFDFVQFHPSYDYTDFVEGLRPVERNGQVYFERHDGIFKTFCAEAALSEKDNDGKKYVFVIDEINRGEISRIFGELFFSIDPSYREVSERIPVKTQYQNLIGKDEKTPDGKPYLFSDGFYVPANVYVIGTMNDIDRSVESMDFAFRRRFAFVEITAAESESMIFKVEKDYSIAQELVARMESLNSAIVDPDRGGLPAQYQIGGAYFLKYRKAGDYQHLWNEYLRGTLFEYFRGMPDAEQKLNLLYTAYNIHA